MNKKEQIKKKIQHIELQIKRLSQNTVSNEVSENLCNTLILQKAILKKDLENLNKNFIVENLKKVIPHKEKLICDYFN